MTNHAPLVRLIVKHPWLTAAAVSVVVLTTVALGVVSGVVPVKASSGHWAITARFLDFAKERSVTTWSLGIEPPPLDDPGLVLRGAAHYENGCYPCHGKPGAGVPPVMAAMTPPPPELRDGLSRWNPGELFTIVKHGIKFTGMPAWPSQRRDDEVWAVVAFLRRMPGLDAAGYQRLAFGDSGTADSWPTDVAGQQPPRVVRDLCWRCHGIDGTGRGPGAFPSLAGQRAAYLYGALRAFADRQRFSRIMSTIAASLRDETMREVADYYEELPPRAPDEPADTSAMERGRAVAERGAADRDVPACAECHGPSETPKNPAYPRLAGQHVRYLALQLRLLQQRQRGGSAYVNLMHVFVDRLRDEDIRSVTAYFASLRQ